MNIPYSCNVLAVREREQQQMYAYVFTSLQLSTRILILLLWGKSVVVREQTLFETGGGGGAEACE